VQDNLFAKLPIALIKCGLLAELKSSSVKDTSDFLKVLTMQWLDAII